MALRLFDLDPCRRWHGRLIAYILREHQRGRSLVEILGDRFVVEHASGAAITHLLEDPHLIQRLSEDCLRPLSADREIVARRVGPVGRSARGHRKSEILLPTRSLARKRSARLAAAD